MGCFYLDFFAYSQTEGEVFDIFALLLPSAIEHKFIHDYKLWVHNGQPLGCSGYNACTETCNPTLGTTLHGMASVALLEPLPLPGVTGVAGLMEVSM